MTSTTAPLTPGRIRTRMKALGLKQKDVAFAANIGEADVSRIVRRDMQPTDAQSARLREVLEPHDESARTPVQMVKVTTNGE